MHTHRDGFPPTDGAIAAWESEGGAAAGGTDALMFGTVNQIAWAAQIKVQVDSEFDRVRKALESAAAKESSERQADVAVFIRILEEKRAEVMRNREAGYFIHDWQELRNQVRELIVADPRYKAIASAKSGSH